jgi:hypothetical protein
LAFGFYWNGLGMEGSRISNVLSFAKQTGLLISPFEGRHYMNYGSEWEKMRKCVRNCDSRWLSRTKIDDSTISSREKLIGNEKQD